MATSVLGLKTFAASDPVDYNEVNDNYVKIDNGVKTAMQGRAAHNYFDNSNWQNKNDIVNQRGKSSYSTNGNEYTIDRWKTQYGTGLTIENGYINIIGQWDIYQVLKNPKDGVYTFAAEIRINSIGDNQPNMYISNGKEILLNAPIGQWKTYILQYDLSSIESDNISFSLSARGGNNSNASISARWAAMYKGSYDASTLPAYQPKGYAAELAECQRYYRNNMFLQAVKSTGNTYFISKSFDIPMLSVPTYTFVKADVYGVGTFTDFTECYLSLDANGVYYALLPTLTSYNNVSLTVNFSRDL